MDSGAAFTGKEASDSFVASDSNAGGTLANTFAAGDQINGGGGADSLAISTLVAGYSLPTAVFATSIESLSLAANGAGTTTTVDTSGAAYADVTSVTVTANSNGTAATAAGAAGVIATAAKTQAVTISDTAGSVVLAGGLSQTVTGKGAITLSGSVGAVSVTNAAQGAGVITVDNGTTVNVTTTTTQLATASTPGTGGAITIGGGTLAAAKGDVTVVNAVKNNNTDHAYTGGAITITGGAVVSVTQTAVQAATPLPGTVNRTTTLGDVTVNGKSATTSVSVVQQAAETAGDNAAPVARVLETAAVKFVADLAPTETVVVGGLTFTAGALGATKEQVAAAFSNLAIGAISGSAKTSVGQFSGALTGWTTGAASDNSVTFTQTVASNVATGNVTDLANTGTAGKTVIATLAQGVQAALADGYVGYANGAVSISDGGYASGAAAIKNTITAVTANQFKSLTISSNALNTLNLAGGDGVFTNASGDVKLNTASSLNIPDRVSSLAVNIGGRVGSVTDADSSYATLKVTTSSSSRADFVAQGATALNVAGTSNLGLNISPTQLLANTAAGTASSVTLSTANAALVRVGDVVRGTGITGIVKVTAVDTSTGVVTLSSSITSTASTYTFDALSSLKSVAVSGSAGLSQGSSGTVDFSGQAALASVNTSATTGTVRVKIDATVASYTGGAGSDRVTTSGAVSKVISLGGGDDTVTLASGVTSLSNNITAGDGVDTLSMVAADAVTADNSAAFASYLSGFEKLSLTGATGAQEVDLAALGLTNDVTLARTGSSDTDTTLTGLVSGGTVTIGARVNEGDSVILTNAAWDVVTSTGDSITVKIGSAASETATNYATLSVQGLENITLNATQANVAALTGAPIANGAVVATFAIADAGAGATDLLSKLAVTGNSAVSLNVANSDGLRTIDASANLGGVTVTAASTLSTTITGGSGNDDLSAHSSSTLADTLIGGAGNDKLTSNAGLTSLTGGSGNDTFVIAVAGASKNVFTTITDFSVGDKIVLSDKGAAEVFNATKVTLATGVTESLTEFANAAATGDGSTNGITRWFQFGSDTYLVQDVSSAGTFQDGTDIMVKISGLVDLSNLALSQGSSAASSLTLFG